MWDHEQEHPTFARATDTAGFSTNEVPCEIDESDDNARAKTGAYGIRTRDLLNAIEALYQLS
jgi:hypothetical protein